MRTFIQESTLYPDLIQYLKEQGLDAIGKTKFRHNQTSPDILFTYADQKFVLEVKLGDSKVGPSAIAQASRYAKTLKTNNFIVIIFPKKLKEQEAIDSTQLKKIVLETPSFVFVSSDKWVDYIEAITFKELVEKLSTIANV